MHRPVAGNINKIMIPETPCAFIAVKNEQAIRPFVSAEIFVKPGRHKLLSAAFRKNIGLRNKIISVFVAFRFFAHDKESGKLAVFIKYIHPAGMFGHDVVVSGSSYVGF